MSVTNAQSIGGGDDFSPTKVPTETTGRIILKFFREKDLALA